MKLLRLTLLLSFAVLSYPVHAQESICSLKLDQAPTIRGFHLGMSEDSIRFLFPQIRPISTDEVGSKFAFISMNAMQALTKAEGMNVDSTTTERLRGVSMIRLYLFDGKLLLIGIDYSASTKWESTEGFVKSLSESLRLPAAWKGGEVKVLDCDGFQIKASSNGGGQIEMVDLTAQRAREKRVADLEEKRRKTFKP